MRKVKSTALLGAFVAVASLGVISHEAHGATVTSIVNTIAKEALPNNVPLPGPVVTSGVNYPSNATVTLSLSGASFISDSSYSIVSAPASTTCPATATGNLSSVTFSNCSLSTNYSYTIVGGGFNTLFMVNGSQGTSSIVLSYTSNVGNDTPSSVTLAQVKQQLFVKPASATTFFIDPSSLSTFSGGSNSAYNAMSISSATGFSLAIASDTLYVAFNGIPSSVSSISTSFTYTYNSVTDTASSNYTQGTGSATVSLMLPSGDAVFGKNSPNSNTASFSFINSGNIQPGTIYISSIQGTQGIYTYFSGSQNFLTFGLPGTQIYIPDALAPYGGNAIQHGYITISMPSSASIASISVLNTSASCPTNGILTSTSTPNVFYIDLSTLASLCTGLSASAWQSGVPLVIYISGTNATPNNITADAYAVFNDHLKRIPVNVLNSSSVSSNGVFSY